MHMGRKPAKRTKGTPRQGGRARKKKPPIKVHLGNVGEQGAKRTREMAKAAQVYGGKVRIVPKARYVGIDAEKPSSYPDQVAMNWKQIATDFHSGLKQLKSNTVSEIESILAVGHYVPRGQAKAGIERYTARVLNAAYGKLRKGGVLKIAVGPRAYGLEQVRAALKGTKFRAENIEVREFSAEEYNLTHWAYVFKPRPLYWIIAKK